MIKIINEDCKNVMHRIYKKGKKVDVILTSPFYSTNKKAGNNRTLKNTKVKSGQYDYVRYDVFVDNLTNEQYYDYMVKLFKMYDKVLAKNGVVLFNMSYGSENTECMFLAISNILKRTNFTLADVIGWKKKTALPNACSSNKLTRIFEFVFVLCRRDEFHTFFCNKQVVSKRKNGQKMYENIYNFVEAKNNDGSCPFNKATYSSELCVKLLKLYAPLHKGHKCVVYDSFMGSGTTAVACKMLGISCIGSEISENQCKYAKGRLEATEEGIALK